MCGNFGLLLLCPAASPLVRKLLEVMIRVTMMRGAQSAGIVTYEGDASVGVRKRVVNGKRTDLCSLLLSKFAAQMKPSRIAAPQLFQGHTRFATSSIANMPGCHPHQWSPAKKQMHWLADENGRFAGKLANVEMYITHNGDLDFFEWHGVTYPLDDVFIILERLLHFKRPSSVDSAGVAGLLELLRTAGLWEASVRYGYVFGALPRAGKLNHVLDTIWSASTLASATATFERVWVKVLAAHMLVEASGGDIELGVRAANAGLRRAMVEALSDEKLPPVLPEVSKDRSWRRCSPEEVTAARDRFISTAVDAFFDQGLLAASRQLLNGAQGSFGLGLSCSLDARSEFVIAARGQTMSIAFYPQLGLVTFGSESAATKAGMGESVPEKFDGAASPELMGGFRYDLNDVDGEVVQLTWGEGGVAAHPAAVPVMKYGSKCDGVLRSACFIDANAGNVDSGKCTPPLLKRSLRLGENPLLEPLPKMGVADPIGEDIRAIPDVVRRIQDDWNDPSSSLNRLTAYTLFFKLRPRLLAHANGTHDGSIDLLITGCEVSLWIGEQ